MPLFFMFMVLEIQQENSWGYDFVKLQNTQNITQYLTCINKWLSIETEIT